MVEIVYLIPGTGLSTEERDRREGVANDLCSATVTVVEADDGPSSIESDVEDAWSGVGVVQKLWQLRHEYDAAVIGCFGDPGLGPSRELLDVPVVGPCEATVHTATQIAGRFSWLTILDSTAPKSRARAHELGVADSCASVRSVDATVESIDHDSAELVERMVRTGRRAVEEDGAEALVPGCMSLGFMQAHDEVQQRLGVPLVDPVAVSLEQAATWARHGISQSKATYPTPELEKLDGLLETTRTAEADD